MSQAPSGAVVLWGLLDRDDYTRLTRTATENPMHSALQPLRDEGMVIFKVGV